MRRLGWWLAAALAACGVNEAEVVGGTAPLDERARGLEGGTLTTAHPAIGLLANEGALRGNGSICTGTLISDSVVLTAAHCAGSGFAIGFDLPSGRRWHTVSRVLVHPSYAGDAAPAAQMVPFDVALMFLEARVPDLVPMGIASARVHVGTPITYVGYGRFETGPDGRGDSRKRLGGNVVSAVDQVQGGQASPNAFMSQKAQGESTALLCPGDSGGPALVQEGTEWRIAGISSRSSCANTGTPATRVSISVSAVDHLAWVRQQLASAAPRSGHARPLVGDFDGNGQADLALVGHPGWLSFTLALSSGRGAEHAWTERVGLGLDFMRWATGPNVTPVTGDFDGDGKSDLALVGGQGWSTVPVARSTGTGAFAVSNPAVPWGGQSFAQWAQAPGAKVFVGDFDGDGRDDLALAQAQGWGSIPIAYGEANGQWSIANHAVPGWAEWAAAPNAQVLAADFDGDGRTDLAIQGPGGWGSLPVAYARGRAGFEVHNPPVPGFAGWASLANVQALAGDFDGDGKADVLLTGNGGWGTVPIAFSRGRGAWSVTNGWARDFAQWSAAPNATRLVADFTGDGKSDVVLQGPAGWGSIPTAQFDGPDFTVSNVGTGPLPFALWANQAAVRTLTADFDGDGRADVVLTGAAPQWGSIPAAFGTDRPGEFVVTNQPARSFGVLAGPH